MHGSKCLLAGNVSIITSDLFMGTSAERLAQCAWEHLRKVWHYTHGNNCGKSGTIHMGTTVESLALYTWEHLWKVWHYTHGNNCGKSGTIRGLLEKYPTFFFMRTPDGL